MGGLRQRPIGVAASALLLLTLAGCADQTEDADVSVLCSNELAICEQWVDAFTEATGESARMVRLPTSEALERLQDSAGSEFDVWHGGPAEFYVEAAGGGLLAPYTPSGAAAIPAELKDATWTGVYASLLAICTNEEALERQGITAPTNWSELLQPEYRGLISAPSPLASGTAFTTMTLQVDRLGDAAGRNYLAQFYDQVMQFTRSGPAVAGVVASGEAPIGVTFAPYCEQAGLATQIPSDGSAFELGAVAVLEGAKNPQLAERYVDFAVSAAGQESGSRSGIRQLTTRSDTAGSLQDFAEWSASDTGSRIAGHAKLRAELLDWFRQTVGPGA